MKNRKRELDTSLFRILDANLNRSREGLRAVEEYARLALDDTALAARLKKLRHGLAQLESTLTAMAGCHRLAAFRDIVGDVGADRGAAPAIARPDLAATALAAMKRLQEALRVLEEYAKCAAGSKPSAAVRRAAHLRYEAYAIESRLFADQARRQRLRQALLYVLVTSSLASTDAATAAAEALAGGADIIQLREKEMEDGQLYRLAQRIANECRRCGALFIVNDRPHIAALLDADGVHTGWGDLPINLARRVVGYDRLVGRSTDRPARARVAAQAGADYIGVGPVYPTRTKAHRQAVGLAYVRYAAKNATLPYFCIGAINRENIDEVLAAGGRAVAICTAIIASRDIAKEAAWFKERLRQAQKVDSIAGGRSAAIREKEEKNEVCAEH